MGGSSGAAEEAAGHTCFGVQPPGWGWKQPESGERISHLRIRDRGPCEALSLLGWASSLGLSQSIASWPTVQDFSHNYLSLNVKTPSPAGLKDDTLSLITLTFALFWFMGNTQADVYPGIGPRKDCRLVFSRLWSHVLDSKHLNKNPMLRSIIKLPFKVVALGWNSLKLLWQCLLSQADQKLGI